MLEIRLLDRFDVRRDGIPVEIPSRPAQSLLAYLALNAGVTYRREKLAGMLWPESSESNARANLRAALWRIRKSLEAPSGPGLTNLQADDLGVTWDPSGCRVDAEVLQRNPAGLSLEELTESVSAYGGALLPGFYDEWVVPERERLQAVFEQRIAALLGQLAQAQRWAETIEWAERWVGLGGAPEPAYRALMQAHAGLGDSTGVAAAYQRCADALRRELDVEPSEETRRLYEQLRSRPAGPGEAYRVTADGGSSTRPEAGRVVIGSGGRVAGVEAPPPRKLPMPLTPFVGRQADLEEIARLLADPACRLLTLLGPGGAGKTRLALQAAAEQEQSAAFADGVGFAPLAALQAPDFLVSAIASALRYTLHGLQDPWEQLWQYVSAKRLLLVLDNFEHLRDGASQLVDLLAAAPGVKLLVTSRERLNLQAEWLFEVGGLAYPADERAEAAGEFGAIRLFIEAARRVRPGYTLAASDRPAVMRICRSVEGLPLGIELAAAWMRHLSAAEVAAEVERNEGFLATSSRDVPERHRSLRAVFDHSWRLLSDDEKTVFRRASVFRGGFDRAAAAEVAGASLARLSDLADKSLLHRAASGRYEMHELLRQFAGQALEAAGEHERVCRQHAAWYMAIALKAHLHLRGVEQAEWLRRLEAELDNLRAALAWGLRAGEAEMALRTAAALGNFWWRRGYLVEGSAWLSDALAAAADAPPGTRCEALLAASSLQGEQGRRDEAMILARQALRLAQQANDPVHVGFSLGRIGIELGFAGDRQQAAQHLEASLAELRGAGHNWGTAWACLFLADMLMRLGSLAQGAEYWKEGLALFRELGDSWGIAFALGGSGDTARRQGDFRQATALLREALVLHWQNGERVDAIYVLEALAIVAVEERRPAHAARLWGASEALRELISAVLSPGYWTDYETHIVSGRAVLGEAAFEAAWAEGRAMTGDQAVAFAVTDG